MGVSRITLGCIAAVLLAAIAAPSVAVEVSGNVALTSDYSFRGISQTTRDPAIQGGFDLSFDNGWYLGTWGSNVNFGDDASMEWDLYAGWGTNINEHLSFDINYVRYEYPSEGSALDYNELNASLAYDDFTLGIIYSNEYLAIDDLSWFYPYAQYSLNLANNIGRIDLHVGMSLADDDFVGDEDNYIDYSATYNLGIWGVDFSIGIVGTDVKSRNCGDACDARVVVAISKSL